MSRYLTGVGVFCAALIVASLAAWAYTEERRAFGWDLRP